MAPSLPLAGRLQPRPLCPQALECSIRSNPSLAQLRRHEPARQTEARALPPGLAAEQSALYRQTEDATDRASAKFVDEYRRAAGVCLVRDGLVFAARRIDDAEGTWQMPQGGIDYLENPMVAAVRELQEETGITSARIVAAKDEWLQYDSPTCVRSHFTGRWVRYKGQTQKWFLMKFYGSDSEVDLERNGEREFSGYTWLPLEEIAAQVVDFKREVYAEVAREFCPIIKRMSESS